MNYRISLTTHEPRLISCIPMLNKVLTYDKDTVNSITLYISDKFINDTPDALNNLTKKGLQIRYVKDKGPATKLLPALLEYPEDYIITIDDDNIYPEENIKSIIQCSKENPKDLICIRARKYIEGKPFLQWPDTNSRNMKEATSNAYSFLGSCGVCYPPHCLHEIVHNDHLRNNLTPKNDDFWFWYAALKNGTTIRMAPIIAQITQLGHPPAPLWGYNKHHNDATIKRLFEGLPDFKKLVLS